MLHAVHRHAHAALTLNPLTLKLAMDAERRIDVAVLDAVHRHAHAALAQPM